MTLDSILSADPNNPTVKPVPYVGIQFAAIPEFAGIATQVSQEFSAVYAGQQTVEEALAKAHRPSLLKKWKPQGTEASSPAGGQTTAPPQHSSTTHVFLAGCVTPEQRGLASWLPNIPDPLHA